MAMSGPQIERAYETPFIRQFDVFMPNRVGKLCELLTLLDESKVEVAGLSVVDSAEWAVVRMVFDDPGKAREKLKAAAVAFTESDVLAVEISEAETLNKICKALVAAELNLQFAYPLFIRHNDYPVPGVPYRRPRPDRAGPHETRLHTPRPRRRLNRRLARITDH